jgi:hypothetical protein
MGATAEAIRTAFRAQINPMHCLNCEFEYTDSAEGRSLLKSTEPKR